MTRALAAIALSALAHAAVLAHAPAARAQDEETVSARASFQEGVRAAREERWADAVDSFQASYEASPRPITMFNLAGALAQLGRLVEAAEAYRSFLSMARTGTAARMRGDAEEQLRALEDRIPRTRLRVLGLADDDVVRLDEWEVSHAALDLPVPVDPGAHTITIVRAGTERSIPFTAVEGVASEVVVDARPESWAAGPSAPDLAVRPDGPGTGPGASGPRSILEEPVFWIIVGSVVVVGVGIGIGAGVAAQGGGDPYVGNVGPGGVRL